MSTGRFDFVRNLNNFIRPYLQDILSFTIDFIIIDNLIASFCKVKYFTKYSL